MEYVRDWNFRAMYGAWDAMKNVDKVLPNYRLNWSAHILGKRESRRLMGDVVLGLDDLKQDRRFPDGCVPTGWSNDIHQPDSRYNRGFEGNAFIAKANHGRFPAYDEGRPYWLPFRALYSRNVSNLLMAGRCISVTHDALGAVRVMRTGGCEGEIIGMAASLCKEHDTDPRGVYETHLKELQTLMSRGVGKRPAEPLPPRRPRRVVKLAEPAWLKTAGKNLARTAKVHIPGAPEEPVRTCLRLNDGQGNVTDNTGRLVYRGRLPHVVEFEWDKPVTVAAARVISGYYTGSVTAPVENFALQWHDGTEWRDSEVRVAGNTSPAWSARFEPVKTRKIRLVVTKTQDDISRIWEVELYGE